MVALSFINKTKKTKFKGIFQLDSTNYEFTMYLLPITKQKEYNEIVNYFGNRMFKGGVCLEVDETAIEEYLDNNDVSAFIMVNPEGIDNIASGTLQIYNWCNSSSASLSKSQNIDNADVWINDVCRVSSSGNTGTPLKALFYFMEQLVVQNLGKTNIKLYIDSEPDNVSVLKPKYESLRFEKNIIDNPEICPNWTGSEIVMEKSGLTEETQVIDFSFLHSSRTTARTTAKGINKHKKTNKHNNKHNKSHHKHNKSHHKHNKSHHKHK